MPTDAVMSDYANANAGNQGPPSGSPVNGNPNSNPLNLPPIPGTQAKDPHDYGLGALGNTVLVGSANLFGLPNGDVTFAKALDAFTQANPQTVAQIQTDLIVSGFYPRGAVSFVQGRLGQVTSADTDALKKALMTPARAGADVSAYIDGLSQFAQVAGPLGNIYEPTLHDINLADPAAVGNSLDAAYEKALGRKATTAEKASFTAKFHGEQTDYYQQAYNTQDQLRQQYITASGQAARDARNGTGPYAGGLSPDTSLSGASLRAARQDRNATGDTIQPTPDDVHNDGISLAAKYGLAVTSWKRTPEQNAAVGGAHDSDHLTGMAVDIAGDPGNPQSYQAMNALAAWAQQNEGPGKIFRWVGWQVPGHYDHVHLSFNASITDPNAVQALQNALPASPQSAETGDSYTRERDAFMAAVGDTESSTYDWNHGASGAVHGKYQFTDGTWATAARMAGVAVNDHSPVAQDSAARALMDHYWAKYHDWGLVAAAWNGGEGTGDRVQADPTAADRISDGHVTIAQYQQRVLSRFAAHGGGGNTSGLANDIYGVPLSQTMTRTQPDLNPEAYDTARAANPVEAGAHDLATTYDTFTKLLGTTVSPERSVDPRLATQATQGGF